MVTIETIDDASIISTGVINLAMRMAKKSNHRYRHGAVVMRGSSVLAFGANINYRHAEFSALNKLWPVHRRGSTVLSIRITDGGTNITNAKPCENCMNYMIEWGVARVYYSCGDRSIKCIKIRGV